MENVNGKSRASFRWMLSCATIGLVVSISPCFAQGNRDVAQETQRLGAAPPEITTPFKCDSLDPKVCFDIYWRILNNEPAPAASLLGVGSVTPPCMAEFAELRDDVQQRGLAAKAAGQRKAGREEMCKHITAYSAAELKWVKYTEANVASCAIQAELVSQLKRLHSNTEQTKKKICAAGPITGPFPSLRD